MTSEPTEKGGINLKRRAVMRAAGASTIGIAGLSGVASASDTCNLEYHFYGCSQVCVNMGHVYAIVWNGHRLVSRCITMSSNRNDPPVRGWKDVYCLEVKDGEAIVGICYKGKLTKNMNRCAENYKTPTCCSY
jgi:hypothetical protein